MLTRDALKLYTDPSVRTFARALLGLTPYVYPYPGTVFTENREHEIAFYLSLTKPSSSVIKGDTLPFNGVYLVDIHPNPLTRSDLMNIPNSFERLLGRIALSLGRLTIHEPCLLIDPYENKKTLPDYFIGNKDGTHGTFCEITKQTRANMGKDERERKQKQERILQSLGRHNYFMGSHGDYETMRNSSQLPW